MPVMRPLENCERLEVISMCFGGFDWLEELLFYRFFVSESGGVGSARAKHTRVFRPPSARLDPGFFALRNLFSYNGPLVTFLCSCSTLIAVCPDFSTYDVLRIAPFSRKRHLGPGANASSPSLIIHPLLLL